MAASTQGPVTCGYDGSDNAVRALVWAAQRARDTGAGLRVISADLAVGRVIAVDAGARENVETRLREEVGSHIGDVGVDFTAEVAASSPTTALVGASESASAVVVGSRGLGRREDLVMGSVSAAVVEHAECPVLVVTPDTPAYSDDGPVVLATDGSTNGTGATNYAFAEATRRGVPLTALHVVETPRVGLLRIAGSITPEMIDADEKEITEALRPFVRANPDVEVEISVKSGDAADLLMEASRGAAMVVMGSRGHGGFAGLLLGSVSRRVMQRASATVAIIR